MSETCPTIKINNPDDDGYIIINACDFDESQHEEYIEKEEIQPLSKAEIIEALEALDIEYKSSMKKAELQAILDAAVE